MQTARHENCSRRATLQQSPWWAVNWDYPPSPAAYHHALLARGALHSRFLRIAYSSARESTSHVSPPPAYLTSTSPPRNSAVRLPPIPPYPLSLPCARSANPTSHTLKRRKPQWPKPPHYHTSLLRSPLSHRKGLFRAVLPPEKALDFFRWDVVVLSPYQARDRARDGTSLRVAECVLEPYEAAAGFFGWHGVGLDVIRRVDGNWDECGSDDCCWNEEAAFQEEDSARMGRSGLQFEVDEAAVEEGRARWARTAEELVGPPGLPSQWILESGKVGASLDPAHKYVSRASSLISSSREEVRWDLDVGSSSPRPSRSPPSSDEKRKSPCSTSKPERTTDSPSAWWHGCPHRGPPPTTHLPLLRFPPPPSVQYGAPLHFSPWIPGGRVPSAQGHGYWYGARPIDAPSPMSRDPNLANSHLSHSHVFATTSIHPIQSPRHPTKSSLGRDEHGSGHETETDHGYESATTTTDSDPPPHTPIGAATTSHCVEALQVHGDDEVEVHGVEIDEEHASASVTISLSDPTTPVKLLGRFTMSTSPSVSPDSAGSHREGYGSSKAAVVFPSLNGSFRQGSMSQTTVSVSSQGMSAQTTPARTTVPGGSSSRSSAKESTRVGSDEEGHYSKMQSGGGSEPAACSVSGDGFAVALSQCSSPPTSPSPGLRKDSQGFWEPVTPISLSSSSSSSHSLSLSEGKTGSRPTAGWIGDKSSPVTEEGSESPEAASLTHSTKSRSLSPGPRRVTSAGSICSPISRPALFSSTASASTPASACGGSYPSSPSPPSGASLPNNPTTLLPAFLATATVKRKKASRTREIVDRLRSSSIDAGKGGGLESLGWLAGPGAGEQDGALGNASLGSEHVVGQHGAGGQTSSTTPSKSSADSASWLGSGLGKNKGNGQALVTKSSDTGSSGKSNGTTQAMVSGSDTLSTVASSKGVKMVNPGITPFPILSVSPTSASHFTNTHQSRTSSGREHVPPTSSGGGDGSKMNASVATSPSARNTGLPFRPSTPAGSPTHHAHHPLPSPSRPTVHPPPPLAPPPMLAVTPYPHPMFVPFTQYRLAPPNQLPQGQGTWVAVYPGHPPHVPVHPIPAQTHVAPITGVSGMRHVTW